MSITRVFDAHVTPDALRVSGDLDRGRADPRARPHLRLPPERSHEHGRAHGRARAVWAERPRAAHREPRHRRRAGRRAGRDVRDAADAPGRVVPRAPRRRHGRQDDAPRLRVGRLLRRRVRIQLAVPATAPWVAAGTEVVLSAAHGARRPRAAPSEGADAVAPVPRLSPGDYACEVELQARGSASLPWVCVRPRPVARTTCGGSWWPWIACRTRGPRRTGTFCDSFKRSEPLSRPRHRNRDKPTHARTHAPAPRPAPPPRSSCAAPRCRRRPSSNSSSYTYESPRNRSRPSSVPRGRRVAGRARRRARGSARPAGR